MPLYRNSATPPPLTSGHYYFPLSGSTTGTSAALGNGVLRLAPVMIYTAVSITRLAGEVTVVGDAGSKLRLGIYADNGSTYPGALVLDAGVIAGDSATVQELTISQSLAPGLYWFGGAVQIVTTTQPTVRVCNAPPIVAISGGTSLPAAGAGLLGFTQSSVTGALPSNFSTTVATTFNVPRLIMKAA
jgi:hypothetical protein